MEHRLKRALTTPFILLAAFVLWFWEWLWEPLQRAMTWLGRLPLLRQVDAWVAQAPRYIALALFVVPGVVLLPFKLAGLYFLAHGAPLLGVATFLAAKVVGTALLARIFTLTRPQLLQIVWFARCYTAVTRFKAAVFERLHAHPGLPAGPCRPVGATPASPSCSSRAFLSPALPLASHHAPFAKARPDELIPGGGTKPAPVGQLKGSQPTTSTHSATQPSALMQARAMGGDRPPWPALDTGNQVASGQA